MKSVYEIIQELNEENGSNYKIATLEKYKDHELLKRVLKMTYDKVDFTYGISMKNITVPEHQSKDPTLLKFALDALEFKFKSRQYTGNAAIELLEKTFGLMSSNDQDVLRGIVNRDLRINMGRSNINKVFKNLITKPVYMRCGIYNDKTKSKIDPRGSFIQLKADGTYREFRVQKGEVTVISRSGETYEYPFITDVLSHAKDGYYFGELTVLDENGNVLDRSTGNGMINSDDVPHDALCFDVWDYVTEEEYDNAKNKVKNTTSYQDRFTDLQNIINHIPSDVNSGYIKIIPYVVVDTIKEALERTSRWMNMGYEGAILKDKNAVFRDGTSPQQLKLKLEIDAEVRITGFTDGTPGTVREKTFGAITFETDDGMIKGQTSGFTDALLKDFNSRRDELIGTIMTVQFNDVTKARNNDYWALSHPRFIELRPDRDDTDTIERVMQSKEMAMELG